MISPHQMRQIAVQAVVSDRTVRRYYTATHETYPAVRRAIEQAARELGLPLPSRPSSVGSSQTRSPSSGR